MKTNDALSWYASLNHGGLLIAPSRLPEFFPETPPLLSARAEERLRRALTRVQSSDGDAVQALLDTVLEEVIGLGRRYEKGVGEWLKGSSVSSDWTRHAVTGEAIKPRRVWQGPNQAVLPVFFDDEKRIGMGRGRRSAARVVEWLRRAEHKLALLTNARQWRLIYAGLDHDAYAEADSALWFEEGKAGPQVTALRTLLAPAALTPEKEGALPPLLNAVETSRKGQAELSAELGERCRQAVELLIQAHGEAITKADLNTTPRDIYLAATRIVMRMVVVLFAEARNLLPQDNPIYHDSYGLQGLRESLDRVGGGAGAERLRHRYGAWARVLSLFRLVYEGSPHESLPILRYGGGLFEPGTTDAKEPVLRALSLFEDLQSAPTDDTVHRVLNLLTRSRVKVRQGRRSTWIEAPVDFSDLSSEYIGILYEGLLNYELRRVEEDDPVVFLALGDEPALPLSRLESMDDKAVASLVEKAKKRSALKPSSDEGGEEEEEEPEEEVAEEEGDQEEAEEIEEEESPAEAETADDKRQAARERAQAWARRAVTADKLVAKPRSKKSAALREHKEAVEKTASALIKRTILPGEWFLLRFGGTRKGTGTFYTRPQLAVPIVQRTLRPLAFDPPKDASGNPNEDAPAVEWIPKTPEEILALKVCDPACGSGSFLVASLRFLTDALAQSLHHHKRIEAQGENTLVTLAAGKPETGLLSEETLPCRPEDADFEERLRARLKRYVVEHCIYGVDIDLLAVELCRLSLWVETMDRTLPFSFLDHKIKCGNSLVGCWFDRFRDYPVMAFERGDAGDKSHDRFVHHFREYTVKRGRNKREVQRAGDLWTHQWREVKENAVRPQMRAWITSQREDVFPFMREGYQPEKLHDQALAVFRQLHDLPLHDTEQRARLYRDKFAANPGLVALRRAFDTWCAIWFWPGDELELVPTPDNLQDLPEATQGIVAQLCEEFRFFHWELEFPDVFVGPGAGFDAIIGNPPWETVEPNSVEFFSNIDPLYRTYRTQEATAAQRGYFWSSPNTERAWLAYCAKTKYLTHWAAACHEPFGGPLSSEEATRFSFGSADDRHLHEQWLNLRLRAGYQRGYANPQHPFRYQGAGKTYTHRLFLELAFALTGPNGHLGLLLPAGIYTDKGAKELRTLLLDSCRWEWLYSFENRERIFPIKSTFKFCATIARCGVRTDRITVAFMRRAVEDWEAAPPRGCMLLYRDQIEKLSPKHKLIFETPDHEGMRMLHAMSRESTALCEVREGRWRLRYRQADFNIRQDNSLLLLRDEIEARGFKADRYGRWIRGPWKEARKCLRLEEPGHLRSGDGSCEIPISAIEDVALPLYQGRMIGQFDFAKQAWVRGSGQRAIWEPLQGGKKHVVPQYLVELDDFWAAREKATRQLGPNRVVFKDVVGDTETRTMIAAVVPDFPCADTAQSLHLTGNPHALAAVANSFVFDYWVRLRGVVRHLRFFSVEEVPLPLAAFRRENEALLAGWSLRLGGPHECFARDWLAALAPEDRNSPWRRMWAVTKHERLRIRCILDAIVAELYQVDPDELRNILRDCDHPRELLKGRALTGALALDPKGFWRIDSDLDAELRQTVLTLVAFFELKQLGLEAFLALNDGEGWMLPDMMCLADYGLGHDERAKKPQPVRSRLGPRFYDWQLEQSVEESWAECEMHARNILGEDGFAQLKKQIERGEPVYTPEAALPRAAEPQEEFGSSSPKSLLPDRPYDRDGQGNLFSNKAGRDRRYRSNKKRR